MVALVDGVLGVHHGLFCYCFVASMWKFTGSLAHGVLDLDFTVDYNFDYNFA